MGQQQILLIVLSVILVGIAVSVGISMFRSYSITANQDAMILDVINLATVAYQYRMKPGTMGGSFDGTYSGFGDYFVNYLPPDLRDNDNGSYFIPDDERSNAETIVIRGESKLYPGATIEITYDSQLQRVGEIVKDGWPN